ncbi:monooxygenase [Penicillium vulpinum]|uniref:monooxygenase n=1 Tax=Penicillium vulpinum TaxID=29845 RepID=UPI002547DBAE|nr:monooxygenase [Penicillium vulpinum]KAJ5972070.1 monooxygenase [Penicillium vulpinum]
METVDTDILIIGGGIGGLTLAAICQQLGIHCRVLERTPTLKPVGAGISLAPNALRLLDQLGLYPELLAMGQKVHKIQINRNQERWNTLDWTLVEQNFGYPILSMERHAFHRLLYRVAGGGKTVVMDCKVQDIIDDPAENFVTVVTNSGKQLRGRLVVGADGIRSITRRILAGKANDKTANTIRYTGRVHMSGITSPLSHLGENEKGVANWMLYDDSILTTWSCPDNRQWFIGAKMATDISTPKDKNRSVWAGTTPETVKEAYGNEVHPFSKNGKLGDIVDESERVLASDVFEEVAFPSMAKGRVALLGDAAHSMTSFFGQGGCQAIEDAAVLADLIQEQVLSPGIGFSKLTHQEILI